MAPAKRQAFNGPTMLQEGGECRELQTAHLGDETLSGQITWALLSPAVKINANNIIKTLSP